MTSPTKCNSEDSNIPPLAPTTCCVGTPGIHIRKVAGWRIRFRGLCPRPAGPPSWGWYPFAGITARLNEPTFL